MSNSGSPPAKPGVYLEEISPTRDEAGFYLGVVVDSAVVVAINVNRFAVDVFRKNHHSIKTTECLHNVFITANKHYHTKNINFSVPIALSSVPIALLSVWIAILQKRLR